MDKEQNHLDPERTMRYAVFSIRNSLENGISYRRSFIVLKNGYGMIVRFTRLEDYAGIYSGRTYKPLQADPEPKLHFICGMLNYVIVEHGKRLGVKHVFDITKPMLEEYFNSYAMTEKPDGGYHKESTVETCIAVVTAFMANLSRKFGGFMKVKREELYVEKTIRLHTGKLEVRHIPDFQATGIFEESDGPFRDMPSRVMEILIPMAKKYAPDIAFGIALQAFAGMRAGEVCNVRQECSQYGPGLRFVEIGGQVRRIEIDLTREYKLRSDTKDTGNIKKHRKQGVYPDFINVFMEMYEFHKKYLKSVDFEDEYAPMFVNANGLAMSYETYRRKFKALINDHLRPWLINSTDPEFRLYGQMLYENNLGTHALRHWFTVQLVLRGEDIANIQFWRGDKSPDSAFHYLQNKGDLVRELKITADRLITALIDIGGEMDDE